MSGDSEESPFSKSFPQQGLSQVPTHDSDDGATLVNETNSISDESRSVSRGREEFCSSGRGGIGNIRRSSISSDSRPFDGPDDSDFTRGREQPVHPDRVFSVGRGGAGNRGSPSHSRSRSRGPIIHSTGRGGAGNIQYGAATGVDNMDEEERRKHAHSQGIHSTGRGGAANLTNVHLPDDERVVHYHSEFESSGRGGAGNIRSRSTSRDPSGRTPSRDTKGGHGITALWNKVSHPSSPGSGDPESWEE